MRFSVLHLSDLHRDVDDEIDTTTLLDSLENDIARAANERPPILPPSLCIVTGDMVYGVGPKIPDPDAELARQYEQTEEFLVGLADCFFSGERDRVVILPGNHDVALPTFLASVERVPTPADAGEKAKLVADFFKPKTRLRWSWKELSFYRIVDEDLYANRMRGFASLYRSFYNGKRTFSLDPKLQYDAFDFPRESFSVLTLSSCFNNDLMRRAGSFHPAAVTEVGRLARQPSRAGWLIAAAWHHNVGGGPTQDDYIDNSALQLLIDAGVSAAFHGHQHFTECVEERLRVGPSRRKITIVSAGTLCAGPHHLAGKPRSYNIVEFDTDASTGRVHQREMANRDLGLPIWAPGRFPISNGSYLDFDLERPAQLRPPTLDLQLAIEAAERAVGKKRWADAVAILRPHRNVELARPLLVEALNAIGDARQTIEVLSPPQTIAEAVVFGAAVDEVGTGAEVDAFLASTIVTEATDASVREIARRIRERRAR
jgi:hypothetical protein